MFVDNIVERYINFYTDYAFKKLFGTEANKELLIDFLNALFESPESGEDLRIADIEYLPTERQPLVQAERRAVFDVFCKSTNGEYFIVEMQNARQEFFKDRTIYYSTFPIREEGERGDWNFEQKRIFSVNVLNFNMRKTKDEERWERENGTEDKRYMKFVKLMDTKIKTVFYENLTFVYLEMPKFEKNLGECNTLLDKWLYAIKHLSNLDNQPEELSSAIFDRLFHIAEVAKYSKAERMAYETSLNNMRDYKNTMDWKLKEGVEIGKKMGIEIGERIGIEKGEKRGIEKGRKEGEWEKTVEIVRSMKEFGIGIEQICAMAKISPEEVEEILGK